MKRDELNAIRGRWREREERLICEERKEIKKKRERIYIITIEREREKRKISCMIV